MPVLCSLGERHLCLERQRSKAHVGHEQRYVEVQGPGGFGADHDVRRHSNVVELRPSRELSSDELDVIPCR